MTFKRVIHANPESGLKQTFHMDDEGNITLENQQHVDHLLKACEEERQETAGQKWGEMRRVARIPIVELQKLIPLGILDKQMRIVDHKRFHAWLNDGANSKFRTFEGRV